MKKKACFRTIVFKITFVFMMDLKLTHRVILQYVLIKLQNLSEIQFQRYIIYLSLFLNCLIWTIWENLGWNADSNWIFPKKLHLHFCRTFSIYLRFHQMKSLKNNVTCYFIDKTRCFKQIQNSLHWYLNAFFQYNSDEYSK